MSLERVNMQHNAMQHILLRLYRCPQKWHSEIWRVLGQILIDCDFYSVVIDWMKYAKLSCTPYICIRCLYIVKTTLQKSPHVAVILSQFLQCFSESPCIYIW